MTEPSDEGSIERRPAKGWRDQPKGLACAVIAAFFMMTFVAFALIVLAVFAALH